MKTDMTRIDFSIIIPLYNKEKYIGKTLDSVLSQSYKNFELIIVNDGSTDSSLQCVKQYADERIRIIDKENEGVSATRNRGISEARGEYLCFLDADDILLPNALDEFIHMLKIETCDIYVASFIERNSFGDIVKNGICKTGIYENATKALCFHKIVPRMGNVLIKRRVISTVGLMRTDITLYEDKDWLLRLLKGRKVYASNSIVMEYQRNNKGISHIPFPIDKDLAGSVILDRIDDKYERIILADFLFRRFVRRLLQKDRYGAFKIVKNNRRFLFLLPWATCIRMI